MTETIYCFKCDKTRAKAGAIKKPGGWCCAGCRKRIADAAKRIKEAAA